MSRRWSASPPSPVAALAQPLTDSSAAIVPWLGAPEVLPGEQHGRRREAVGRERGRDRALAAIDQHHRQVGPAGCLDASRRGAGPEAVRAGEPPTRRRAARRGVHRRGGSSSTGQGSSGSCSSPAVSGRPKTTLNAWTAWPAAPLTRLSSDADGEHPSGALVRGHEDPREVAAVHVLGRGRRVHDLHERLAGDTCRGTAPGARRWSPVGSGRTCAADRMPRVIGMRWGRKSTASNGRRRARRGEEAAAPARSPRCGGG